MDQRFEVKRGVEPGANAAALRTRGRFCRLHDHRAEPGWRPPGPDGRRERRRGRRRCNGPIQTSLIGSGLAWLHSKQRFGQTCGASRSRLLGILDHVLLVAVDPAGQAKEDELKLVHGRMITFHPLSSEEPAELYAVLPPSGSVWTPCWHRQKNSRFHGQIGGNAAHESENFY